VLLDGVNVDVGKFVLYALVPVYTLFPASETEPPEEFANTNAVVAI
jgi:hypothetical protein